MSKNKGRSKKSATKKSPSKTIGGKAPEKTKFGERFKFWIGIKLRYLKDLLLGETEYQEKGTKEIFLGEKFIGKKFALIATLFLLYNFVMIYSMQIVEGTVGAVDSIFYVLAFGRPFTMGLVATLFLFELSLVLTNEKIKHFLFQDQTLLKQVILIISVNAGNFLVAEYLIQRGVDFSLFLSILALFWLILQSVRLYNSSRQFATNIESRWVSKYSGFRYIVANIAPWFLVILLTTLSWGYRYFLVLGALDLLGPSVPAQAFQVYQILMRIVMPFVYISLILVFVLILAQTLLTRRMDSVTSKRAGVYDNLTFSLIVFVMFIYLLFQISLFIISNPLTINAVQDWTGEAGGGTSILFIIEFAVSMFFLIRMIQDMRHVYPKGMGFFNIDSMFFFLLAGFMAQTTSRVALFYNPNRQFTAIVDIIQYDNLIIPLFIILVLGITIVMYYLKPQEISMFIRIAKETVEEEDRSMETIMKFLRREFIRRGQSFHLSEVEKALKEVAGLPRGVYLSIISRLDDKYMDIQIKVVEKDGKKDRIIDFIPITEKYQKDPEAQRRAQQFMHQRLTETLKKNNKGLYLEKTAKNVSKESKAFLGALDKQYYQKRKEEEEHEKEIHRNGFSIDKHVRDEDYDLIYDIIRRKYLARVTRVSEYPEEFRFHITEVSDAIAQATRIQLGDQFKLLENLAKRNWNFILREPTDSPDIKEDMLIDFFPISDFEVYEALLQNRPEYLLELHKEITGWFEQAILFDRRLMAKVPSVEDERVRLKGLETRHRAEHGPFGQVGTTSNKFLMEYRLWFAEFMNWMKRKYPVRRREEKLRDIKNLCAVVDEIRASKKARSSK